MTYPVYLSDQTFNDNMDLLLISNEFKSHYVYIKNFDRFMFNKTKNRNKKHFCYCCLECFSSKEILIDYKKDCLVINGKQSGKLKSSPIRFKNYSKQISVPFKIYADFECIFHTQENIKIIFPVVLLIKLFLLTITSVKNCSLQRKRRCLQIY